MTGAVRPTSTIMYFCYGAQAIYDQTAYSILSLLRVAGRDPAVRIVVYCDRPDAFVPLSIETVVTDQPTLDAWLGESDYHHRRKTCAIIDALERFGGAVMFVDSDTYWTKPPARLLARITPGRACFHILEGFLQSTGTPFDAALAQQLAVHRYRLPSGDPVKLDPRTPMWNTGVVGVHANDLRFVRDALVLSDAIWADADPEGAYGKKIHHAEQFAMGYVFRNHRLSEAARWVHHYWTLEAKARVQALLPALVASGYADQSPANLARLYAARHREQGAAAWLDRVKMAVRGAALAAKQPLPGVRRSV